LFLIPICLFCFLPPPRIRFFDRLFFFRYVGPHRCLFCATPPHPHTPTLVASPFRAPLVAASSLFVWRATVTSNPVALPRPSLARRLLLLRGAASRFGWAIPHRHTPHPPSHRRCVRTVAASSLFEGAPVITRYFYNVRALPACCMDNMVVHNAKETLFRLSVSWVASCARLTLWLRCCCGALDCNLALHCTCVSCRTVRLAWRHCRHGLTVHRGCNVRPSSVTMRKARLVVLLLPLTDYCVCCDCRAIRNRCVHTLLRPLSFLPPLLFLGRVTSWIDCRRSLFPQLSFQYIARFEARRS
jgi:hypothetical protein